MELVHFEDFDLSVYYLTVIKILPNETKNVLLL